MKWFLIACFTWILGGGLTMCLMMVSKRADLLAEKMYVDLSTREQENIALEEAQAV